MKQIGKIANYLRSIIERGDEIQEPSGGFLSHRIRQKAVSLMRNYGRQLDIGAGEGLLLKTIESTASKWIYCIDTDREKLEQAAERYSVKNRSLFIVGDGRQLPFGDDIFDEVTLLNLFMNIPDRRVVASVLKDALRICKDQGKIIFDYRNILNPWIFTLYRTVRLHDPDIKLPLRAFTRSEIKGVLRSLGMQKDVVYHPIPSWWKINPPVYLVEINKGTQGKQI
jgi:ubiquinone/menaquinone biosynthesis C-methylase UbiE